MTHPFLHAQTHPDKPAIVIAATGETITYRQLDERSNQGAHLLRSLGLKRGDVMKSFAPQSSMMYCASATVAFDEMHTR